jgi:hypothetical protein
MAFSSPEAALARTAFTDFTKRIGRVLWRRFALTGRLLLLRLSRRNGRQSTQQILNRCLGGSILQPELGDTVGQARISDVQPNFFQPSPTVPEAMACAQQVLDFRPYLENLPNLGSRLSTCSFAEATDVEAPGSVDHH